MSLLRRSYLTRLYFLYLFIAKFVLVYAWTVSLPLFIPNIYGIRLVERTTNMSAYPY